MFISAWARKALTWGVALAVPAAVILVIYRSWSDRVVSDAGRVIVVSTPVSLASPVPNPVPRAPSFQVEQATITPLETTVMTRFPMIREADIVCEDECTLVMALGDQSLGPSPYDGSLERFVAEQGYKVNGSLKIDQPGDNDTLLTLPIARPAK